MAYNSFILNERNDTHMPNNIAKVVMLDRTVYDNIQKDNNTIYFVRESSSDASRMISLYVGEAKQCELLNATDNLQFDQVTNSYELPDAYHVKDKMFFYAQTVVTENIEQGESLDDENSYDYYRIVMWDGQKFRDCMGLPNNVIIVKDGVLPATSDAIKDFMYIDITNRSIYVFDGNSYIQIMSSSPTPPPTPTVDIYVDDVTILGQGTQANPFYGAGADVSGNTFSYNSTSYTSLPGTIVLNKYSGEEGENHATSPNTTVMGFGNFEVIPDGQSQTMIDNQYVYGGNLICGHQNGNNVGGSDPRCLRGLNSSAVIGRWNSFDVSGYTNGSIMVGNKNIIEGSSSGGVSYPTNFQVLGSSNLVTISNTSSANAFVTGTDNNIGLSGSYDVFVLGDHNTSNLSVSPSEKSFVNLIGKYNSVNDIPDITIIGSYSGCVFPSNTSLSNGSFICGKSITSYMLPDSSILIGSNTVCKPYDQVSGSSGGRIVRSQVIGSDNVVECTKNPSNPSAYVDVSDTTCVGKSNKLGSVKQSCVIGTYNSCNTDRTVMLGSGLTAPNDICTVIGYTNSNTYNVTTGAVPRIVFGNAGYTGQTVTERNALVIDSLNNMFLYGDTTSTGNFKTVGNFTNTEKHISLVSTLSTQSVAPVGGLVSMSYLPNNGDQTILSSGSPISKILIASSDTMINGTAVGVTTVSDYCATIVFRKDSSLTDASDILTNFTTPTSQDTYPRIYLLNPDVDITDYTVIHLLIFYDGLNLCCTVAGYKEDTTP